MTKLPHPTEAQVAVVESVDDLTSEHGTPPSLRTLAAHMGLTHPTVLEHLQNLHAKGWVKRAGGKGSGYVLTAAAERALHLNPKPKRLKPDKWKTSRN